MERAVHPTLGPASPYEGADTKMLFFDGSIEHGWTIHAKKLRRALQANSRGTFGYGAPLAAFFEKETR